MRLCSFNSIALAVGMANAVPLFTSTNGFDFAHDMVRGVNIGGWLVLEPWITPSIFRAFTDGSVVDEWTLCEKVPNATAILTKHWDSWVSFADFKRVKDLGFNTVRIPIGYWAYQKTGEPYVAGAAPYLEKAIEWSRQLGLRVWIDLHGAPGSQNGFDNSGHRVNQPGWETGDTIKTTLNVIQMIADQYATPKYQDVVVAIELLNEPLASRLPSTDPLVQFYRDGYGEIRSKSKVAVALHDAFEQAGFFNNVLAPGKAENVIVDHHEYQIFNNEQVALQPWQHRQLVCNNVKSYASNQDHWIVVGEFTGAMTDCAAGLNGYSIGARYSGDYPGSKKVGSCENVNFIETWSQAFKDDMRGYIEAQLEVFEQYTRGYIWWCMKTEASPEWDLFRLVEAGVFPQPLSNRKFTQICSY